MPRGGARQGSGRKPIWNHQPTKAIKVPAPLIEDILKFARLLDNGEVEIEQVIAIVKAQNSLTTEKPEVSIKNKEAVTAEKTALTIKEKAAESTETLSAQTKGKVKLTSSQEQAIALIKKFLQSNQKYFRLTGYAGTGKSFLICHFMKWLTNQEINFVAGEPTNKAVKNLKQLARYGSVNIKANTIAQLLGQQPELNEDTGKEIFVSGKLKASIAEYDLVILDEFSMINKNNFEEIIKEVESSHTKIIFVGDEAQLPPVKEKEPIVATTPLIKDGFTLSEVVRYEGQIGKVAEIIRSDKKYHKTPYPFQTTADRSIVSLTRSEWLETALDYFESRDYRANSDFVRFLVYRNQTAVTLNQYIRTQLWGESAPAYVIGDRLIAKTPVFRPVAGGKGKNKWAIAINNSEECEVIAEAQLSAYQNWQYWQVPVLSDRGLELKLSILTDDSEQERSDKLKELAKYKLWRDYLDLSKRFDNTLFAYALTTHKAQGSSINFTFLDLPDLSKCRDRQKILYTALTRAKQRAFVSLN